MSVNWSEAHPIDRFCYNMFHGRSVSAAFRLKVCFAMWTRFRMLRVMCKIRRYRGDKLSVHHSDSRFASLSRDVRQVGFFVSGFLRSESVAVEDDVLFFFPLQSTKAIRLGIDAAVITEGDEMILTATYLNRKGRSFYVDIQCGTIVL